MPYVTSWERRAAKKATEEATKRAKEDDARKMLEEGLDINVIQRVTGLPVEQIAGLQATEQEPATDQ